MPLVSSKLYNYVLPFGLLLIITLMLNAALVTDTQIERSNQSMINNQIETNAINNLLDTMLNANLQRSYILLEMLDIHDPLKVNDLVLKLNLEMARFSTAREKIDLYDKSRYENSLLYQQSGLTEQNAKIIDKLIGYLLVENYKQATYILNNQAIPNSKLIIKLINRLQIAAREALKIKAKETVDMSIESTDNILSSNLISILISFLLMLFLIYKQREDNNNLSKLANTDILTKLPNRSNFIKNINRAISDDRNSTFAIIFFDIDYFKSINDNYGHEIGDKILKLFSQIISEAISSQDILSRFGGDEFVLLLRSVDHKDDAIQFVKNLSKKLDTSFHIDSNEIFLSASIGASMYSNDATNAKTLLKNADVAMYTAKQSGRNCYQFFSLENSIKLEREHTLSQSLQSILQHRNSTNELYLVYQPLVDINDKHFDECEALIRWKNPYGENVSTVEFIEMAEKSNLIEKVNLFVIEEACKQQHKWQQQGIHNIRININLSGNKRIFSKLFKSLLNNLEKYNLSPELFGIELTERTMYEISEETSKDLRNFRTLGMKIAIDDFGTGYSSLSYLKNLPITSLKIDREFISGLPTDRVDKALVKAIISLSHSLDFDVVAEGVETEEQLEFLKDLKCDTAQGYLLHKPLSSEDITQLKFIV